MIDLKTFDPKSDKIEDWLVKLSKFLDENYWLELLLAGKLVPKIEKPFILTDLDIEGSAIIGGSVKLENHSTEVVGGTIYAEADILKILVRAIAGGKLVVYDKNNAAQFTVDETGAHATAEIGGATVGATYDVAAHNGYILMTLTLGVPQFKAYGDTVQVINTKPGNSHLALVCGGTIYLGNANVDQSGVITLPSNSSGEGTHRLGNFGGALKWGTAVIETLPNKNAASGYAGLTSGTRINGAQINLSEATPASAAATGTKGDVRYDANYLYVCTATDTWARFSKAAW